MATKKTRPVIKINLYCEKCTNEIVATIFRDGVNQTTTEVPNSKKCIKCNSLFCEKCSHKITKNLTENGKCPCCGKVINIVETKWI